MSNYFVEVAPAIPLPYSQRQTYTYHFETKPAEDVLYKIVTVSFGRRKNIKGVIVAITDKKVSYKTQPAILAPYPALTERQVALGQWISHTMQGSLGFTLRLFMPTGRSIQADVPTQAHVIQKTMPQAYVAADWQKRTRKLYEEIKKKLNNKQQVLIIVPEKWIAERLYIFFNKKNVENIVQVHGALSPKKFSSIWKDVYENKARLIIGTQKALFLPFCSLHMVVLEEEAFTSHTLDEQYPRLSNWYGTKKLASLFSSELVYTSSMPSVRLMYGLREKKIESVMNEIKQPKISIIHLTYEDKRKRYMMPPQLLKNVRTWAKNKEKIVILYNRLSNEKITDVIQKFLPRSVKLVRFNAASAAEDVAKGLVILGTSAVLPYVEELSFDRVVWLFPEGSLLYSDFRSRERTLSTLSRLYGNVSAGKEVMVITKYPNLIKERLAGSIETFFDEELKERQRLFLPPYSDMIRLQSSRGALIRKQIMDRHAENKEAIKIRGPIQGYIVLFGRLAYLKRLYTGLAIESVDLDPPHILEQAKK